MNKGIHYWAGKNKYFKLNIDRVSVVELCRGCPHIARKFHRSRARGSGPSCGRVEETLNMTVELNNVHCIFAVITQLFLRYVYCCGGYRKTIMSR